MILSSRGVSVFSIEAVSSFRLRLMAASEGGLRFNGFSDFELGARSLRRGNVFIDINAVALEYREQIIDFLRRVDFGGQTIIYLIVEQVATFLAQIDEIADLIILLFNHLRQRLLRPCLARRFIERNHTSKGMLESLQGANCERRHRRK
jgi:hypothetical protein